MISLHESRNPFKISVTKTPVTVPPSIDQRQFLPPKTDDFSRADTARAKRGRSALGIFAESSSAREERDPKAHQTRSRKERQLAADDSDREDRQLVDQQLETARRFKLLNKARLLLPRERVADCQRKIAPKIETLETGDNYLTTHDHVAVRYNADTRHASFSNLMSCESYSCPVCAQWRSENDRVQLSVGLAEGQKQGLHAVMVTLTMSHDRGEALGALLDVFANAYNSLFSGRWWHDLSNEYEIVGKVKAWETTYSTANGWHPHAHVLLFTRTRFEGDDQSDPDRLIGLFADEIKARWQAVLSKRGRWASWIHGADVKVAHSSIADYVAKFGREPLSRSWGADSEMAKSPAKSHHTDGLTPLQLLAVAAGEIQHEVSPAMAGKLYQEYFYTFKGVARLHWGSNLRKLLKLAEALEAFQIANPPQTDNIREAVKLAPEMWQQVVARELRADLLRVVATDDPAIIRAWCLHNRVFGEVPAKILHIDPDRLTSNLVTV